MRELLPSLFWGLILFQSFAAMGRLAARVLKLPIERDLGLAAGLGLAVMAIVGGSLNFMGLARPAFLIPLVLTIVILDFCIDWRTAVCIGRLGTGSERSDSEKPLSVVVRIAFVLLIGLVGLKYVTSLAVAFNVPDDQPTYLAHAAKMLQTGSVGVDPFSARQLLSLNGQTFLVALLCSVAPLAYVFLLDPGVCWIILAASSWSIVRRDLRGSPMEACLLTAMVLMADAPFINVTGYLTSTVIFLTLVRIAYLLPDDKMKLDLKSIIIIAILIAGLCTLKTTCINYVAAFVVTWLVMKWRQIGTATAIRESFFLVLVSLCFLLPWMLQQYLSGGSFLYPYLGKGVHLAGPGFEVFSDPLVLRLKSLGFYLSQAPTVVAIVALLLLAFHPFSDEMNKWRVLLASQFATTAWSLTFAFYTVSIALGRMTHGFLYASLVLAGLNGFVRGGVCRAQLGIALCLALMVGSMWANLHFKISIVRDVIKTGRPDSLGADGQEERIRNAQSKIPAGKTVLVALQNAYVLDYSRNNILNLDQLGMASPRPGLPLGENSADLLSFLARRTSQFPKAASAGQMLLYLRESKIAYVMFQKGPGTAWYNKGMLAETPYWSRLVDTFATLVFEELKTLIPEVRSVFDDGDLMVLDLNDPLPPK